MQDYNVTFAAATSRPVADIEARVGHPAPDFTLEDIHHQRVTLSDYRHQAHVVLVFGNMT